MNLKINVKWKVGNLSFNFLKTLERKFSHSNFFDVF